MVTVENIRHELQLPAEVISDSSVQYAIGKCADDLNLVCAEVLRMVLRRYRGRTKLMLKNYTEVIDLRDIRKQIAGYVSQSASATFDDGTLPSDPIFTMEGI
jgi:hypothetical protein